jgi:hypothetical protein
MKYPCPRGKTGQNLGALRASVGGGPRRSLWWECGERIGGVVARRKFWLHLRSHRGRRSGGRRSWSKVTPTSGLQGGEPGFSRGDPILPLSWERRGLFPFHDGDPRGCAELGIAWRGAHGSSTTLRTAPCYGALIGMADRVLFRPGHQPRGSAPGGEDMAIEGLFHPGPGSAGPVETCWTGANSWRWRPGATDLRGAGGSCPSGSGPVLHDPTEGCFGEG